MAAWIHGSRGEGKNIPFHITYGAPSTLALSQGPKGQAFPLFYLECFPSMPLHNLQVSIYVTSPIEAISDHDPQSTESLCRCSTLPLKPSSVLHLLQAVITYG